jgi:hypothetical protein
VTRVELTELARQELDSVITTRELPPAAYDRVREVAELLALFPEMGDALGGRYSAFRCLEVAWGWLVLLYSHVVADDLVLIVGFYDDRVQGAPHP